MRKAENVPRRFGSFSKMNHCSVCCFVLGAKTQKGTNKNKKWASSVTSGDFCDHWNLIFEISFECVNHLMKGKFPHTCKPFIQIKKLKVICEKSRAEGNPGAQVISMKPLILHLLP